jgi:NDP-sugar pyrophosphorylase family protein
MTGDVLPSTVGVVMAGGSGQRMRSSGELSSKPLVTVLGVPLVERNLMAMLRAGMGDVRVVVASGSGGDQVARWATERGTVLASAGGARLSVIREPHRLGNCGGLALLGSRDGDALLVFADNLTDLDLTALMGVHAERRAALTLAIHAEPFRLPYGVVDIVDGSVAGYREKPTLTLTVSSGLAVVSADARAVLRGPAGLAELANAVVARGLVAAIHQHEALWIDVNDRDGADMASRLIQSAPDRFEKFWPPAVLDQAAGHFSQPDRAAAPDPLLLDDVSAEGTPIRIDVATAHPGQLSPEGWARVLAWREVVR